MARTEVFAYLIGEFSRRLDVTSPTIVPVELRTRFSPFSVCMTLRVHRVKVEIGLDDKANKLPEH